jgi:hypothetical protein
MLSQHTLRAGYNDTLALRRPLISLFHPITVSIFTTSHGSKAGTEWAYLLYMDHTISI